MKILSVSDVITNSSSEVFCIIHSDNIQILEEICNTLGSDFCTDDEGNGGLFLDEEDNIIEVAFSYSSYFSGLEKLAKFGLEKLLEPWNSQIKIEYR